MKILILAGGFITRLSEETRIMIAFRHHGFLHAMDTHKDKQKLEELWNSGNASWKTWS